MPILGLINTENFASQRFKSVRRKVFYDFPNGSFPITGITSMIKEETCSDPEFKWHEKRLQEQKTTTAAVSGGNGPLAGSGAGTNNSWGTTLRTGGAGVDAGGATVLGEKVSVKVADTGLFRVGHIIEITGVTINATTVKTRVLLRVGQIGASNFLDCTFITVTGAGITNNGSTANNSLQVLVVGTAFPQGAVGSSTSPYNLPTDIVNYCQILRTKFSFTGTAAKTSATFDNSGLYKDRSKDASINHLIELEKMLIFGQRAKVVDSTDNDRPTYFSGGILWFLEQWEKGASGAIVYRTGSSIVDDTTKDTDDDKRIIHNVAGTMSDKQYDGYIERVFRITNNKANEKLVVCGSGFLNVINQLYKNKSQLITDVPMTDTYGMDVVGHRSPFGKLWYKTHPLFSQNAILRNCALVMDVGNMVYRYVEGRDTEILAHREPNDADYREDEWLTECGLEMRYPESCMFLQNVLDYVP